MKRRTFIKGMGAVVLVSSIIPSTTKAKEHPCKRCGCVGTRSLGDTKWSLPEEVDGVYLCKPCARIYITKEAIDLAFGQAWWHPREGM